MKRLLLLAAVLALTPAPAAADGCPASRCGTTSSAVPGSRHLYLRVNGRLVVYDVVSGTTGATLPRGIASADGRTYVAPSWPKRGPTTVRRYALPSGKLLGSVRVAGRLVAQAVSPDGKRVVLAEPGARTTRLLVLEGLRPIRSVRLRGMFEVESLSPDGLRLFLIHWKNNGYDLQLYDFTRRRLRATPTFEPNGETEKMVGQAWAGVATRNGRWLLTLYTEGDGSSFVHALDLRRGVGHCVDLPVVGMLPANGASALVLSPDETRLYVANPLLGFVSTIDLRRPRVVRTMRFRTPLRMTTFSFGVGPNGASSRAGRTIAFSGSKLVWRYDTQSGRLGGPFRTGAVVTGVAIAPDGRVVALAPNGSMTKIGG
ncbi:MAG: hypothetical protein H0T20_07200 [Actinobacteria bacterium]|nr:hypothetical protein [Actinomycetota bacterium]